MSFFRRRPKPDPICARCGKRLVWIDDPPVWVDKDAYDTACGFTAQGVEYEHQGITNPIRTTR